MDDKNGTNGKVVLDEDQSIVDYNAWRTKYNLPVVRKRGGQRKKQHTMTLTSEAMDGLIFLARLHGCFHGGQASVSALVEAIGVFDIGLLSPDDGQTKISLALSEKKRWLEGVEGKNSDTDSTNDSE